MPESRRLFLIAPPFYRLFKDTYSNDRYPLALGYLAGTVRKETRWNVLACNADFNPVNESKNMAYLSGAGFQNYLEQLKNPAGTIWEDIRTTISDYSPDVVGISTTTQSFASARIVARIAKELNPRTLVVMGGPHPSMTGADVLQCPDVDVVVRGEGERTLVELLAAMDSGGGFGSVRGICRRENGRAVENPARELIKDLDTLCWPHESAPEALNDFGQYPPTAFRYVFATRGCPYNCFFCGSRNIWGRTVRFRSPMNVVSEIQSLRKRGLHSVFFDDDTFGVNKKYIRQLCEALITHCPGLKWGSEIHVNLVDDDIIALMKKAGCYVISVGVESGNNDILKRIRKTFTIEEAHAAASLIKRHGIEVICFFMVGFPWETEATLNDTARAMRRIRCDAVVYSIFTPYPGTEAFALCREMGLVRDDFDVSRYNHQSPENCFCKEIPRDRFRAITLRIEKMVDRKNFHNRLRKMFSLDICWRIQELGPSGSIKKAFRILLGR